MPRSEESIQREAAKRSTPEYKAQANKRLQQWRALHPRTEEEKARDRKRLHAKYHENPGPIIQKNNQRLLWRLARLTPEELAKFWRKKSAKRAKNLTNTYIAHLLRIKVRDAPPELIELKRQIILLKRACNPNNPYHDTIPTTPG